MKTVCNLTVMILFVAMLGGAALGQATVPAGQGAGPASVQVLTTEEMIRIAEDFIYQSIPWKGEEVTVKVAQSIPRVALPAGKVDVVPSMESSRPLGLVPVRLDIRVNDQLYRSVRAFFHIRAIAPVVVVRQTIQRGQAFDPGKLDMMSKDLSLLPANVVTSPAQLEGKVSKWTISPGTTLTMAMVDDLPLVRRGENVMLVITGKGVSVSVQGRAMADGKKGDTISVMNLSTRKEIPAKVVDVGRVEVANP